MRRSVSLLAFLLLSLPQTALALGVSFSAGKANVAPGFSNRLTLVLTNIGGTPVTGLLRYDVVSNSASLLDAAASNPAVKCELTAQNGPLFYRCTANSITLQPGASVTTTVDLLVPLSTPDGTEIVSTAAVTLQMADGRFDETATVTFRVGSNAGPILAIEIIRTREENLSLYGYLAVYDITIKNVGSAPTTGPITIDATVGRRASDAEPVPIEDHMSILQPNESIHRKNTEYYENRGEVVFTVTAEGGGAPRAVETDTLVLDPRDTIPKIAEIPLIIGGRRR